MKLSERLQPQRPIHEPGLSLIDEAFQAAFRVHEELLSERNEVVSFFSYFFSWTAELLLYSHQHLRTSFLPYQ